MSGGARGICWNGSKWFFFRDPWMGGQGTQAASLFIMYPSVSGEAPWHDLTDPGRGPAWLVAQAGHRLLPILQPQPCVAHHRPRRLLPLPLRFRGS